MCHLGLREILGIFSLILTRYSKSIDDWWWYWKYLQPCFALCHYAHFYPIFPSVHLSLLPLHPPLYLHLGVACSGCSTRKAIFVDYVCTLTDGPTRRNVSLLLRDVETFCQLLIQADWWQRGNGEKRHLAVFVGQIISVFLLSCSTTDKSMLVIIFIKLNVMYSEGGFSSAEGHLSLHIYPWSKS